MSDALDEKEREQQIAALQAQIPAFLVELSAVCRKYGMHISGEYDPEVVRPNTPIYLPDRRAYAVLGGELGWDPEKQEYQQH